MDELILLLILGFIILIFLLSFRNQWVIVANSYPSSQLSSSISSNKQNVPIPTDSNNAEPSPPCINKLCCSKTTFGCCSDNISTKFDSIGTNCL